MPTTPLHFFAVCQNIYVHIEEQYEIQLIRKTVARLLMSVAMTCTIWHVLSDNFSPWADDTANPSSLNEKLGLDHVL